METLVTILHVMVCVFLMLTVLLQAGKGGGMGAAFGGGSSMGTVFGGSGAGNFLRRLTVAAAVIFMITSMTLAWMATPSVDPIKEYWADQQASKTERDRAHKAALDPKTQPAKAGDQASQGSDDSAVKAPPSGEAGGESSMESGAGATGPEGGDGADKAGDTAAAAGKTGDSAADKTGGEASDKAGEEAKKGKTGDEPVEDKPVEDKPVEDKPASGSTPPAPAPAKSSDSTP